MGCADFPEKTGRLTMAISTQMQRYQWVQNSGKGYIVLPGLVRPGLFHFFGTRFLSSGGVDPSDFTGVRATVQARQVHGDQICRVGREAVGDRYIQEPLVGDGLTTDRPHILIGVSTADCVPVLLFDPIRKAVSAVHAGWRGTVLNIAGRAVEKMGLMYGSRPEELLAGIGPCIGPCCYEVGNDVWENIERDYPDWKEAVLNDKEGKAKLDLVLLNKLQLLDAGLRAENISFSGLCTACLPTLFYSFRRDKKRVGHMTSGIMLALDS